MLTGRADDRDFTVNEPTQQRREVCYEGHVQGVGFRYTARRIASQFDVTGFVRNLPNGRVQLVLEGPPDQLDQMLGELNAAMGQYIRRADMQRLDATGEFIRFEIAF